MFGKPHSSVLPGFNRSLQHLNREVCGWDGKKGGRRQRQEGRRCGRRVDLRWLDASIGNGSGRRSLRGCPVRTLGWRRACRRRSGRDGSVKVAACHRLLRSPCRGATCHSKSEKRSRCCAPKIVTSGGSPRLRAHLSPTQTPVNRLGMWRHRKRPAAIPQIMATGRRNPTAQYPRSSRPNSCCPSSQSQNR